MSDEERTRGRRQRWLAILALSAIVASGAYARTQLKVEWSPEAIRELVQSYGLWGPVVLVLLIAFRLVFLIPSQVMLVAAGICFGFVEGTIYGVIGVTLSGLIAFALARGVGGGRLRERVPQNLLRVFDAAGRRGGALLVMLGTGYPIGPMTAFHAGAGLTRMSYTLFVGAVLSGALLRAVTFTFLGSRLVERGLAGAWPALLPLGVLLLPLLHRTTREKIASWLR